MFNTTLWFNDPNPCVSHDPGDCHENVFSGCHGASIKGDSNQEGNHLLEDEERIIILAGTSIAGLHHIS